MKFKSSIVSVFIVLVVFLIIIPLNPVFLDLMFIINITISLATFLMAEKQEQLSKPSESL